MSSPAGMSPGFSQRPSQPPQSPAMNTNSAEDEYGVSVRPMRRMYHKMELKICYEN